MEESYDIIEIDNEEYAICDKIQLNGNLYWLISKVNKDELSEEVEVVKVKDGTVESITDEKEQEELKKYINKKIEETE